MTSSLRMRGRITTVVVSLAVLAMSLGGCGKSSPLAPDPTGMQYTKDNPPPFLSSTLPRGALSASATAPQDWYEVASTWVDAGEDKSVGGSRYELQFHPGSLSKGAQVTIRERDSHVIEFQLDPHGKTFQEPVDLTIDFAGTSADPGSGIANGSIPVLYWFNETTGVWEVVPGTREGLKFHTTLRHFSLYGLVEGKAGW